MDKATKQLKKNIVSQTVRQTKRLLDKQERNKTDTEKKKMERETISEKNTKIQVSWDTSFQLWKLTNEVTKQARSHNIKVKKICILTLFKLII